MKLEMLTLLLPKTVDMTAIGMGKSHDSISAEDVNILLSYLKLDKKEVAIVMAKFLDDSNSRSELFASLYTEALDIFEGSKIKEEGIKKIVECSLTEFLTQACPFCNGVGHNIFGNTIEKCHHCRDGLFIFDNKSRASLMGLKENEYIRINKRYNRVMSKLNDLEWSALGKLHA